MDLAWNFHWVTDTQIENLALGYSSGVTLFLPHMQVSLLLKGSAFFFQSHSYINP
jgi:hypothetical protein